MNKKTVKNRGQMRYTEQQSLTQIRFVQFTGLQATDRFHVKASRHIDSWHHCSDFSRDKGKYQC